MGMVLVMISVQMFLDGVSRYLNPELLTVLLSRGRSA